MRGLIAAIALLSGAPALAQDVVVTVAAAKDGSRTLVHEAVVPGAVADVWRAVSTEEGWREWAVPVVRSLPDQRFETSYNPQSATGGPDTIEQQWLNRTPMRQASFRTVRTPAGFPYAASYLKVVSTITLMAEGPGATRVRLVQTGYGGDPAGDALIGFFKQGNEATLRQLYRRFVSGPIDWAAASGKPKGD